VGRRGQGEGTIVKRKDGRWAAVVSEGFGIGPGGRPKRLRKVYYGKTRDEAARALRAAQNTKDSGATLAVGRQTLGVFIDKWLAGVRASVAPSTYDGYEHLVRVHIKPGLGRVQLSKLTPQLIQDWMNSLAKAPRVPRPGLRDRKPLSPRTIKYAHSVLRTALNTAVRWGVVTRNAASLAKPPRQVLEPIEPLSPEQAMTLLDHAAEVEDRLVNLYAVAVAEGLRQGELLGLKWSDVDWDKGQLKIVRSLQIVAGQPAFVSPKTHRSRRGIQLSRTGLDALKAQRELQARERLRAGSAWAPARQFKDLIFTNASGGPLHGSWVTKTFQARLTECELPKQRFHDLRHAMATFLLAQGVPMKVVSEKLGHAQIGITMNLYSHVTLAMQKEAATAMDQLLHRARRHP
jgi:integrase